MDSRPPIEVAAAVIQHPDGRFLLAERPAGKPYAGYWEFPGGKIEQGESPRHALDRELHEELGIHVRTAHPWLTRVYAYPHATVRLHFFRVSRWEGEPHGKENQHFDWQLPGQVNVSPLLPANGPILKALELPALYGITHATEMGTETFLAHLDAALANGLRLVQVREKTLPSAELEHFASEVVSRAHRHGARVLINGELDIVTATGADGIHLSAEQLSKMERRPDVAWCGASCHNREELDRATELGLDFAVLSPVKPTRTHPEARALGWETFASLTADYPLPVYALGGMTEDDLETARHHGAHGICLMRGAWEQPPPPQLHKTSLI